MKRLHDRVNIIPVIAKADSMTPEECHAFKRTVRLLITSYNLMLVLVLKPNIILDLCTNILLNNIKKKK